MLGLLLSLALNAQTSAFQRMVIPALDEALAANGVSKAIEWFCYDRPRHSPGDFASYNKVHLDGGSSVKFGDDAPITLQQAFDKGYIELEGGYGGLKIKNLTGKPAVVKSISPTIFGDVAGDTKWVAKKTVDRLFSHGPEQEGIWYTRRKIMVYNEEGLLNTEDPTAEQLAGADQRFKAKHHTINNSQLRNLVLARAADIEEEEGLLATKIKVYKYYGLIKNENPGKEELRSADATYKKSLSDISTDSYFIDKVNFVLRHENYLTNDQLDIPLLKVKEVEYKKAHGITSQDEFTSVIEKSYTGIIIKEEHKNRAFYAIGAYPDGTVAIRLVEQELGLPVTGSLNSSAVETILYYYDNLYAIEKLREVNPEAFIKSVKSVKKELGLPTGLAVDEPTKTLFSNLSAQLKAGGHSPIDVLNSEASNGKLYLLVAGEKLYSRKVITFDPSTNQLTTSKAYMRSAGYGTYINKVSGDLYVVGDRLVGIDRFYSELQQHQLLSEDKAVIFDKELPAQDVQSIVSTYQIKSIASNGETLLPDFRITSVEYDLPTNQDIVIKTIPYEPNYRDVQWELKKKATIPAGSGIVGRIKFLVYSVRQSIAPTLKAGVERICDRMRADATVNFAKELKRELEANGIELRTVKATMSEIEITIAPDKLHGNKDQLCAR